MNVYQRPLFRQMGGPVAPGMAAQEAMMPPQAPMAGGQDPSAMLQQAEAMASQQAQGVGEQYAQGTLANIDRAETPEQIINALRGNEVPLEQRYAELAQFVGEADAQRTPESVLALVQPTIMMTEQGAMDSGVGELMQTLLGEVEMETADGTPTEMGQGIGSLMMAGAPAAPEMGVGQQPVANFRQGGVVQRFQAGGEASRLQTLYSEMLPVYQGILGDGEDQRRMTQAQILFDIADRAGAFAAGIDPRTGQSVARLSPAAQLAAAASGLGGQIGERLGSQEEQDRALRLAALQAAQGEYSAERAAARAAAGRERGIGDAYEAVDAEGNVIATEFLSTRADLDAFREANPGATVRQARAPRETVLRDVGGDLYDLTDPNNPRLVISGTADRDMREIGGSLVDVTDPANPTVVFQAPGQAELRAVGDVLLNVTDPANPQVVYQAPSEVERDIRTIDGALVDITDPATPQVLYQAPGQSELRTVGDVLLNVTDPANPQVVYQAPRDTPRDIRTIDGALVDITDPATPQVLYQAPGQAELRSVGDVLLNVTDPANPQVVYQAPSATPRELRTVEGSVIDFTDPANPQVLYQAPAAGPSGEFINILMPDGTTQSVRADDPQADALIRQGGRRVSTTAAPVPNVLTNPDLMASYGRGRTSPEDTARIQAAIAENSRSVFNNQTGQFERPAITPLILQAEQARRDAGLPTVLTLAEPGEPSPEGAARLEQLEEVGGAGFGSGAFFRNIGNVLLSPTGAVPAPQTQDAVNAVTALNQDALISFRELTAGRPAQDAINQFQQLLPDPAIFFQSPRGAASQVEQLINLYNANIAAARDAAASGAASATQRQQLEQAIISAQRMVDAYSALRAGILGGTTGGGRVDPSQFRR